MYDNLMASDQSADFHRTYRIILFCISLIHRNRFCSTSAGPVVKCLLHNITLLLTCSSRSLLLIAHTVRALLFCTVMHCAAQYDTVHTAHRSLWIFVICQDAKSLGCFMND